MGDFGVFETELLMVSLISYSSYSFPVYFIVYLFVQARLGYTQRFRNDVGILYYLIRVQGRLNIIELWWVWYQLKSYILIIISCDFLYFSWLISAISLQIHIHYCIFYCFDKFYMNNICVWLCQRRHLMYSWSSWRERFNTSQFTKITTKSGWLSR